MSGFTLGEHESWQNIQNRQTMGKTLNLTLTEICCLLRLFDQGDVRMTDCGGWVHGRESIIEWLGCFHAKQVGI